MLAFVCSAAHVFPQFIDDLYPVDQQFALQWVQKHVSFEASPLLRV